MPRGTRHPLDASKRPTLEPGLRLRLLGPLRATSHSSCQPFALQDAVIGKEVR
jgi:hypothetical protein